MPSTVSLRRPLPSKAPLWDSLQICRIWILGLQLLLIHYTIICILCTVQNEINRLIIFFLHLPLLHARFIFQHRVTWDGFIMRFFCRCLFHHCQTDFPFLERVHSWKVCMGVPLSVCASLRTESNCCAPLILEHFVQEPFVDVVGQAYMLFWGGGEHNACASHDARSEKWLKIWWTSAVFLKPFF